MARERLADLLAGLGIHNRAPRPRDDALAFATEHRSPDVILMRLGKDAPLGRQIERSVTIVITPILSGLHHCYARI
jgi:hypothetical protein